MLTIMLIVNPVSGRGSFRSDFGEVLRILYLGGYLPTVYFTSGKGDATALAAHHAANYDVVGVLGGDGTLNEVVTGLMRLPTPTPVGYFPMGTANDVAATLKISHNPVEAARAIITGSPVELDVGAFGPKDFFTYIAAFGAFTEVSYETPQEQKRALGHLAYLLEGMARLPKLTHYHAVVKCDGAVYEDDYIFGCVVNSTSVAGVFRLDEPRILLDDGLFEVVLIRNPRTLTELQRLMSELLTQNYSGEFLTVVRTARARFIFKEPVAWTRDGESGGKNTDVLIENRARALRIIL